MSVAKDQFSIFSRIRFDETEHRYHIDGAPAHELSVTRLVKKYKREFEQEKMATRVARRTGATTQQILAEWEMNRLYSATIGTMLHQYAESFYQNLPFNDSIQVKELGFNEKEKIKQNLPVMIEYFLNFYNDHRHLMCITNELTVGDLEDTKICGTADMICYNTTTNSYELLDFKTNKKLNDSCPYGKMFFPFDDMDECEISDYTVQLNIYKHFIEKYTNVKIDAMKLVWIQPINSNYKVIELVDIQDKISLMFERFKITDSLFEG